MKKLLYLVLVLMVLSSCNTNFYKQKSPFVYRQHVGNCVSNDPINWWYRFGVGRSYKNPGVYAKKHRSLF
jgi:hypothetical protein